MRLILSILINALAVYITAELLGGVTVDGFSAAIITAIVLGLVNWTVRPILTFLTLPITVMTLGLFLLVINGLMVLLADYLLTGFAVANIWWALGFLLLLSIFNGILSSLFGTKKSQA